MIRFLKSPLKQWAMAKILGYTEEISDREMMIRQCSIEMQDESISLDTMLHNIRATTLNEAAIARCEWWRRFFEYIAHAC